MKRLKIILKSNVLILFLFFISLISISRVNSVSTYKEGEFKSTCLVKEIHSKKTILECDEDIEIDSIDNLKIGDIIYVSGYLEEFEKNRNFNLLNYKDYQKNNGIFYKLILSEYKLIRNSNKPLLKIKKIIKDRINNYDSHKYLESFILGDKSYLDEETKNMYVNLGIIHIFSISGMHISILLELIDKIFKRNNYKKKIIGYSIIYFYYLLIDSISLLRSLIFLLVKDINKILNLNISKYRIIIISILIMLIIRGSAIKEIGFYYSVIISSGIYLSSKRLSRINNKVFKSLYIYFLAYVLSLPLNIYLYYEINLFSIANNIILIPIISIFIFPLSLVTLVFPIFDQLLFNTLVIFEKISFILNTFSINLILMKPSIIVVVLYYILIILFFYNKRFMILLLISFLIHKNINYIVPSTYLIALDVGQGDSILIHNGNYNLLIDTGGNQNSNFSITNNITIKVLKSYGIDRLNYLIITHGDFDHMGETINLVNNFKVEKVIFNCGEYNDLEKDLIKILDKKKIKYYSCIKELNIDKNKLYFLQTKEYDNENDNSNVIYTNLNGYKFMFMGDASITTEEEILSKYNLPDIDVLKVGHHGSKTSSSTEFIDEINPKYSIISVGKNNRYGHPNKEALKNLENSKIYRTDKDGSIMFKIKNNKLRVKTCSP